MSSFSKRDSKVYNKFREFFLWFVCTCFVGTYSRIMYDYKLEGKENMPTDQRFIVAGNHISGKDPFLLPFALQIPIAFMAKEELFEHFLSRFLMNYCGAFAVRRDNVQVSTIKTALNIKNTNWMLGLFPQGTRDPSHRVEKITRGFASFAKATKVGILPVAVLGSDKEPRLFNKEKLTIKIGKLIPYSDNIENMMISWCETISELTGKDYVLE